MIKRLMYKWKTVLEWGEILWVDISRIYNKKTELWKWLWFAIEWLIDFDLRKKIKWEKKKLNLMFCSKCRWWVPYFVKNKKAFCYKCWNYLWTVCKVKDLEILTNKKVMIKNKMNDNKNLKFNIIVYPWETLRDILKSEKMTQKELAKKIWVSEKNISNIINWKARITVKTAVKLKEIFGTSARFWLNLQTSYDLQKFNLIK